MFLHLSKSVQGGFWLILSCLCWGANYMAARMIMVKSVFTPNDVTFWRYLIAGLILALAALLVSGPQKLFSIPRRDIPQLIGQGILMEGVSYTLLWCAKLTNAENAAMIDAMIPVMILLGGTFIGEKIRRIQIGGMAICTVGCLLVIRVLTSGGLQIRSIHIGDVLIPVSAGCWAAYVIWGRNLVRRVDSMVYTAWTLLTASGAALFISCFDGGLTPVPFEWESYLLLGEMILFPTIGAFWAWNQASKLVALPLQNVAQYLIPVSAVLMAHLFLGERMDPFQWIGLLLITCGILLDPAILGWLRARLGHFQKIS